jgi:hypothetical protein
LLKGLVVLRVVTRVAQGIGGAQSGDKGCSRDWWCSEWWQGLLKKLVVLRVVARIAQEIGALKLGSNEGLGRAKSLSAN